MVDWEGREWVETVVEEGMWGEETGVETGGEVGARTRSGRGVAVVVGVVNYTDGDQKNHPLVQRGEEDVRQ